MPKKREKSSPDACNSNPPKSRAGCKNKMANTNTQVNGSSNDQRGALQSADQSQAAQQFMVPSAFQYPQLISNMSPMNAVNAGSPTFNMQPVNMANMQTMSNNVPLLQTILQKIESIECNMKEVKSSQAQIECKLGQLDKINSAVNNITVRLGDFEKRLSEIEESQNFICKQYDSVSSSVCKNADDLRQAQTEIKRLASENDRLRKAHDSVVDDVIDLKCRSMRDNLLFLWSRKYPTLPMTHGTLQADNPQM